MTSDLPIKFDQVLGQAGIGAGPLWAPAVDAQGCAVRLDRARRGGQPSPQIAMEAFEGSQSRVLGRCLRQIHSIHSLPSLHALKQDRDITCYIQGAIQECLRCSCTSTSASASEAALLQQSQRARSALQQCISTSGDGKS